MTGAQINEYKSQFSEHYNTQCNFTDQQVNFYYRLPNIKQRIILFEKIQFLVDKHIEKKQRIVRPQNNFSRHSSVVQSKNSKKVLDEYNDF